MYKGNEFRIKTKKFDDIPESKRDVIEIKIFY